MRLKANEIAGRTVTLKVKYADFTQVTRSRTGPGLTGGDEVRNAGMALLQGVCPVAKGVRLLGLTLSGLDDPDLPAGDNDGVEVVYPDRRGRDAADERIVEYLSARADASAFTVVTSDRALAADARALGADVIGARTFLTRLAEIDT